MSEIDENNRPASLGVWVAALGSTLILGDHMCSEPDASGRFPGVF
jgi:hypothetical protein